MCLTEINKFREEYSKEVVIDIDITYNKTKIIQQDTEQQQKNKKSGNSRHDLHPSPSKHKTTTTSPNRKKGHHNNRHHRKSKKKKKKQIVVPFGQKKKMYLQWCQTAAASRKTATDETTIENVSTGNVALKTKTNSNDVLKMTKEERRKQLLSENILRSLNEQKEFVQFDEKTTMSILKLDTTTIENDKNEDGVKEDEEQGTTKDDLFLAISESCPVVRRVYGYYKSGRSMSKGKIFENCFCVYKGFQRFYIYVLLLGSNCVLNYFLFFH